MIGLRCKDSFIRLHYHALYTKLIHAHVNGSVNFHGFEPPDAGLFATQSCGCVERGRGYAV